MMEQGMLCLFPGLAPRPPTVPEFDMDGFSVRTVVKDFPVNYHILLGKTLDPNHGLLLKMFLGSTYTQCSMINHNRLEEKVFMIERAAK
jgi:hypothetical protein